MKKAIILSIINLFFIFPIKVHAASVNQDRTVIESVSFIILVFIFVNIICLFVYSAYRRYKLLKMANIDPLTGLMRYEKFCEDGAKILANSDGEYSLIYLDIDNFKYINEVFGYEDGTKVLKEFSDKIKEYFDKSLVIARITGDKFAVITSREKALEYFSDPFISDNKGIGIKNQLSSDYYRVYTSAGIYHLDDYEKDISFCLDCADIARMKEKRIYGNTCVVFSKQMARAASVKNKIIHSMEKGIENKEFTMMYQPKVCVKTGEVVGAEALVRWVSGYYNMIYPDNFIPIFEGNGFILKLDYYVFERVCECLEKNPKMKEVKISINLSTITLLDGDIVHVLLNILNKHNISTSSIDIEITETALIQDTKKAVDKVNQLRAAGFTISMDDFGTGMSGLSRFSEIEVDTLKIDKSFLERAQYSEKARKTLESIIKLGKEIGVTTVAEGIETKEELQLITDIDCEQYQGFLFSKPLGEEEFMKLL